MDSNIRVYDTRDAYTIKFSFSRPAGPAGHDDKASTMNATAFDQRLRTKPVPANDEATETIERFKQSRLNWRESPESLLRQSVMKTAASYPTLIEFGSVYADDKA